MVQLGVQLLHWSYVRYKLREAVSDPHFSLLFSLSKAPFVAFLPFIKLGIITGAMLKKTIF